MERVEKLRLAVEKTLSEWADFIRPRIAPADQETQPEIIFDRANNRYVLFDVGWKGNRRIYSLIAHIDIIDGKIWIQEDNTEDGVATDLEKYGVSKNEIVLAFKPVSLRKFTDYATA